MKKIVISLALLAGSLLSITFAILFITTEIYFYRNFSIFIGILATFLQGVLVYSFYEENNNKDNE